MGKFATAFEGLQQGQPSDTRSQTRFTEATVNTRFGYSYTDDTRESNKEAKSGIPWVDVNDQDALIRTADTPRIIMFNQTDIIGNPYGVAQALLEGYEVSNSGNLLQNTHLGKHTTNTYLAVNLVTNLLESGVINTGGEEVNHATTKKEAKRLIISSYYPTFVNEFLVPTAAVVGICDNFQNAGLEYNLEQRQDILAYAYFARIRPEDLQHFIPDLTQLELDVYARFYAATWSYSGDSTPTLKKGDLYSFLQNIGYTGYPHDVPNTHRIQISQYPKIIYENGLDAWISMGHQSYDFNGNPDTTFANVIVTGYMEHHVVAHPQNSTDPKTYYMKHKSLSVCGTGCNKCALRSICKINFS